MVQAEGVDPSSRAECQICNCPYLDPFVGSPNIDGPIVEAAPPPCASELKLNSLTTLPPEANKLGSHSAVAVELPTPTWF